MPVPLGRRPSRTAVLSIIAVLVVVPASLSAAGSVAKDPEDPWGKMEEALRVLWTGDPAAKRSTAENAYFDFRPLFDDDLDPTDEKMIRVLASLKSLVWSEADDFISYRLVSELADQEDDLLTPLLLQALKSRSPNLRWSGIRWFADHTYPDALPELEYAWRHEERPWAKAALMIALVRHGSRDHAEEFLDLARGKDSSLSLAAIRALTMIGDRQVIPFLVKTARSSHSNTGLMALDALARWPDSREALDAALEASRSPHVDFQRHAASLLKSFDDPVAASRIYEMATQHPDPYVRSVALESLSTQSSVDPPALASIALKILWEPPTQENAPTQSAAISTLRNLDDPTVLPQLAGIQFDVDDSRFFELRWLIRHLSRVRDETEPAASSSPASSVEGDDDVVLIEESGEGLVIAPPPATLTVRCWEYPGVPGDPEDFPRLEAGTEVEIEDHFEQDHESWVRIDENDCWVLSSYVVTPHASDTSKQRDKEKTMFVRREFDLSVSEAEGDVAQGLMEAGLLEVIDPGNEVIGVALNLDPTDFDRVLLLARSCGLDDTILDGEIYDLVSEIAPFYREHPVLDRFRKTPEAPRGDTDEAIDLDLSELTDH